MADKRRVCIIGGGATGVALLWTLSQNEKARREWDITLLHNQPELGGHSLTYPVEHNGKTLNLDIGVQFIAPVSRQETAECERLGLGRCAYQYRESQHNYATSHVFTTQRFSSVRLTY